MSGLVGSCPSTPLPAFGGLSAATGAFLSLGSNSGRFSALARSIARKPIGKKSFGVSSYDILAAGLVLLSLEMVEKPWSEETMMLVEAARPSSSSALRSWARLSSAFLIPAIEVGPLMPGVMVLRLSPVLCWLPSGSRDQNTSTNGLLRALNIGSTTLVATSAM